MTPTWLRYSGSGRAIAYQVTRRLHLRCGYDFLFWPSVYRAGDQIDMTINPYLLPPPVTPLPGPLRPAPRLHQTSFWAQGVSLGLEYRF